jgi:hypothetical protein
MALPPDALLHHGPLRCGGVKSMASVSVEMTTKASAETVWNAIRDIGALHTRLVPGFVVHTDVEPGARVVTLSLQPPKPP